MIQSRSFAAKKLKKTISKHATAFKSTLHTVRDLISLVAPLHDVTRRHVFFFHPCQRLRNFCLQAEGAEEAAQNKCHLNANFVHFWLFCCWSEYWISFVKISVFYSGKPCSTWHFSPLPNYTSLSVRHVMLWKVFKLLLNKFIVKVLQNKVSRSFQWDALGSRDDLMMTTVASRSVESGFCCFFGRFFGWLSTRDFSRWDFRRWNFEPAWQFESTWKFERWDWWDRWELGDGDCDENDEEDWLDECHFYFGLFVGFEVDSISSKWLEFVMSSVSHRPAFILKRRRSCWT